MTMMRSLSKAVGHAAPSTTRTTIDPMILHHAAANRLNGRSPTGLGVQGWFRLRMFTLRHLHEHHLRHDQQQMSTLTLHHNMIMTPTLMAGTMKRSMGTTAGAISTKKKKNSKNRTVSDNETPRKKIFFQSLGCPRNFVDSEVMLGLAMQDCQMDVTSDPDDADVVVVNTCGFLKSARQESKDVIRQFSSNKEHQGKAHQQRLLVTGCMVNHYKTKQKLLDEFPNVDAVLTAGEVDRIVETLHGLDGGGSGSGSGGGNQQQKTFRETATDTGRRRNGNDIKSTTIPTSPNNNDTAVVDSHKQGRSERKSFLEQGDTPRFLATPPHYAYLKIAEGCRKRCAFCIIPKLKGQLQSKPISQVVDEFHAILQHGLANEVILIAQDLGDYGKDFRMVGGNDGGVSLVDDVASDGDDDDGMTRPNKPGNKSHLTDLLKAMLQSMDENGNMNNEADDDNRFWLRLLYLYPDEITPDLIDLMQHDNRIARYVDMPIQHINNEMLKRMRRKTTGDDIKATITMLRHQLADITIRTSLMVGFPGETESQFEELIDFVKTYKLDHVGVFMYENEDGAASSKMDGQVPLEVKEDRYRRLMEAQWTVVETKHQERVNNRERLQVVVEGLVQHQDEDDDMTGDEGNTSGVRVVGRHVGQCPDIDGQVILEVDEDDAGQVNLYAGERCWVEVVGYDGYDLIGRVVPSQSHSSSLKLKTARKKTSSSSRGRGRKR